MKQKPSVTPRTEEKLQTNNTDNRGVFIKPEADDTLKQMKTFLDVLLKEIDKDRSSENTAPQKEQQ
jgi:hypothetical protein